MLIMMMMIRMMMMGVLPMSNDLMKHVSPWLVLAPTSPLCTTCLGQVFNIYIHPSYIHTEYMPYMPFELSEDPSNPTYSESLLCTTFLGQVVNIYIHPRCFLATYTPTRTSTMADSARLSTFCPCVRLLRQLRPLTFLQCNV